MHAQMHTRNAYYTVHSPDDTVCSQKPDFIFKKVYKLACVNHADVLRAVSRN